MGNVFTSNEFYKLYSVPGQFLKRLCIKHSITKMSLLPDKIVGLIFSAAITNDLNVK